jgi:hypothetical protein
MLISSRLGAAVTAARCADWRLPVGPPAGSTMHALLCYGGSSSQQKCCNRWHWQCLSCHWHFSEIKLIELHVITSQGPCRDGVYTFNGMLCPLLRVSISNNSLLSSAISNAGALRQDERRTGRRS